MDEARKSEISQTINTADYLKKVWYRFRNDKLIT